MNVPLTRIRQPAYFVLAALLAGPLRAEDMSDGRVRLATGALYTELDRLAAAGYVHRAASGETGSGWVYALTRPGLRALQADASRTAARAGYGGRVGSIVSLGGQVLPGGRG